MSEWLINFTCCADVHNGPIGHPANDSTPRFREVWDLVPPPKLVLGDGDELIQFPKLGARIGTDVQGNHDPDPSKPEVLVVGNTAFTHGHLGDPRAIRWFGRPVSKVVGWLERGDPDIDVKLAAWFQKVFAGGRHGEWEHYREWAYKLACELDVEQVIMGHLHQRRFARYKGVRITCIGCCCNGRMDFVDVPVRTKTQEEAQAWMNQRPRKMSLGSW